MLGKCFFVICTLSVVCAFFTGNVTALSGAVFEGCASAVEVSFSLLGMMCLWCGVMEVFRDAGITDAIARILAPLLCRIFPDSADDSELMGDIASSVTANLLGVSGAATPYALRAMERMDKKQGSDTTASDDMVTLSLLGCGSISLFPTTVITLRHSAGSVAPYDILVPVWICSAVCMTFSVCISRLSARRTKKIERKGLSNGNAVVSGASRTSHRRGNAHGVW